MKKNRILQIIFIFALLSGTVSGCHYLDLDEETTSLTEDQVFATYSRSSAFLGRALAQLEYAYPFELERIFIYGGSWAAQTDAADTGAPTSPSTSEFKKCNLSESMLDRYSYIDGTATTGGNLQISYNMWRIIRMANKAIENYDKMIDGTDVERNEYLGEAYFIRALAHFNLCRFFGGVPYLDHVLQADESWDIPRESSHATYVKAAEDFFKAYEYLNAAGYMRRNTPTNLNTGTKQLELPSGCTALALRARALMYAASPLNNEGGTSDWEAAAEASAFALSAALENGFTIQPIESYTDMFHTVTITNETIWPHIQSLANTSNNISTIIPSILTRGTGLSSMTGYGTHPTQNFVDRFETLDGYPLQTAAQRAAAVAAGSYNEQDPYRDRDPRMDLNIIHDGLPAFAQAKISSGGGCFNIYYDSEAKSWPRTTLNGVNVSLGIDWDTQALATEGYTNTGYYARKYYDGSFSGAHAIVDPMVRLAELYLNYAECVNEAFGPSGRVSTYSNVNLTAVEAVNVIRRRAGIADVRSEYTGSAAALRERIQNERCVEFAFESNHYWFDIRRWKTAPQLMTATLQGMYIATCPPDAEHPLGKVYTRRDLSSARQGTWKDCMYVLPFSHSEEITMTNFVNNAPWH